MAFISCVVFGLAGTGLVYIEGSVDAFILSGIAVVYMVMMMIINERRGFAWTRIKAGERRSYFNQLESYILFGLIMLNMFVDAWVFLQR